MKLPKFETALVLAIVLGMALPVVITLVSEVFVPKNLRIESVLTHSFLELAGAVIALLLVGIFVFKNKKKSLAPAEMICAFMSMGILDFMHALTPPGNNFVWLHSLAVFFGGFFLSLLWLPVFRSTEKAKSWFRPSLGFAFLLISGIALFSRLYPAMVPLMVINGAFSSFAEALNIGGGILFLFAMFYFINEYSRVNNEEVLILAILCSLFGAAGILFSFSALWDINWWSWHVLRVAAYLFTLLLIVKKSAKANLFGDEQK